MASNKTGNRRATRHVDHVLEATGFDLPSPVYERQITRHLAIRPTNAKAAGRPTSRDLVRQEAERCLKACREVPLLKKLATDISRWLAVKHPTLPGMEPRTVEGLIRDLWRAA